MDDRRVVWDRANRKHIVEDHPEQLITIREVEEAMSDVARDEEPDPRRKDYCLVRGRTQSGRLLYIAWIEHRGGRYPVHAHAMGRRGR